MVGRALATLIGFSVLLAPSFVSSAHYSRKVTYLATVEQRGEIVHVTPTTKQYRAIFRIVDKYRHTKKGIDPAEFAQAVTSTSIPLLLTAVARAESSYVKTAANPSGAYGLFQVMPRVWGRLNDRRSAAAQAQQAEKVVLHYLKVNRGKLRPALAGYLGGGGPGSQYVEAVLRTYHELQRESRV